MLYNLVSFIHKNGLDEAILGGNAHKKKLI